MARPVKPSLLHKLHKTDRPEVRRRAAREPKPDGDLRTPPDFLTAAQKAGWRYAIRNAPAGLLKKIDRAALVAFVVAEDNFRRAVIADAQIRQERSAAVMFRAIAQLGFSPASRPKISVGGEGEAASPWSEFDGRVAA